MARVWLAALILLAAVAGAGAWGWGGIAVPSFIAIGGGLSDENEAIYKRMLGRRDTDKIVIVPYSSADPEGAAERAIERFKRHRPDAQYVVLPDPLKDAESRRLAAAWIAHADLVYFTGGDQSRLTPRFLADGRPNDVLQALESGMQRWATPVAGTSAGAAALSDPMFTGGGSEAALAGVPADKGAEGGREPARGVRLGRGLGLVRGVILDSHFISRGRLGRMVAALEASGTRYGVGIADDRAVSIRGNLFQAIGDAAAVVVDVGEMEREGLSRLNVRVSLLSDGDGFAPHATPRTTNPLTGADVYGQRGERIDRLPEAAGLAAGLPESPGAWDRDALLGMLRRLAADPAVPQRALSDRFEVVLSADGRTRFALRPGDPGSLGVAEARLDIRERAR